MWLAKNNNDDIRVFANKPYKHKEHEFSDSMWVTQFCNYGEKVDTNDIEQIILSKLTAEEPIEVMYTLKNGF